MSVASYGEIDGNSEYFESPEKLPMILANTPYVKGHILELQRMHKITEDELNEITLPADIFTHPYELDPAGLS